MNRESRFHHFVCVEVELFVVSPLELVEVIWLKRHGEHVFKGETETDGGVNGVRHIFPLDFVFDEILRDEPL